MNRQIKRLRMRDVRVALCGGDKLPRDFETPRGGQRVTLKYDDPIVAKWYRTGELTFHARKQPSPVSSTGKRRASGHRVLVECPQCGKIVPAGRLHQHEGSRLCHEAALGLVLRDLNDMLVVVQLRDRADYESAVATIEYCLREYGLSRRDTCAFVKLTEEVSPHLSEERALRGMREILARYPDALQHGALKAATPVLDMSDAPKSTREEVSHV